MRLVLVIVRDGCAVAATFRDGRAVAKDGPATPAPSPTVANQNDMFSQRFHMVHRMDVSVYENDRF